MKKRELLKNIILPIFLIVCGIVYSFICPPYTKYDLAWFGLVPLLVVLRFSRPKAGFCYGMCFGLGFWFPAISWFISLGDKGCPYPLVICAYILLVLACATFIAIFSMLVARLWRGVNYLTYDEYMAERDKIEELDDREYDRANKAFEIKMKEMGRRIAFAETWRIFVIAIIWVGLEYFRGLAGFSWNNLAISQYKSYPIAQVAVWGGTAAVSFLIVAVNAAFAGVAVRLWRFVYAHQYPRLKRHFDMWLVLILVLISMVFGVKQYRSINQENKIINLGDENVISLVGINSDNESKLVELTKGLSGEYFDLVIWPETSIPYLLPNKKIDKSLSEIVNEGGFNLIVGGVEDTAPEKSEFDLGYNVSYLYSPNSKDKMVYRKRHLVPFGEYLPLDETFPFMRNFAPFGYSVKAGEGAQLFDVNGIKTGMLICFEDTYSWTARESVNAGARILFSHSNDMWFDSDAEKIQHHANAVYRAIETRTPLVRVSNEGYMGVVLPTGETRMLYNPEKESMYEYVAARNKDLSPTLYMIMGDWILAIPSFIFVLIFICFMIYEHRRKIKLAKTEQA